MKGLNNEFKEQAKEIAGQILLEEINNSLDRSRSPVKGGRFKKKKADGTNSELFEFGDLRANISFEEGDGDYVTVGIFESAPTVERLKSYNHNVGDTLPQRRFIPAPNQTFKKPAIDRINRAIKDLRQSQEEATREDEDLVSQILGDI